MPVPVSVFIMTFNEEANIRFSLDSVASWAQEVFVVDSYSEDKTVEICEEFEDQGVRVWQHPFENFASQRNWGLNNLPWSNEWILVLDADEEVSPELKDEMTELLAGGPAHDGYFVKFRFIFFGKWLRHASCYPVWIMRLFRRSRARHRRSVNEYVDIDGTVGRLENDLLHCNHSGLDAWIDKHNKYSGAEAIEYIKVQDRTGAPPSWSQGADKAYVMRRKLKRIFFRMPFRPLLRFLYMYIWRRGFMDGRTGFDYCLLKAIQEFHISCKIREIHYREQASEQTSQ